MRRFFVAFIMFAFVGVLARGQSNPWSSAIHTQGGTTYTVDASDCGTTVLFTNASPITATLPATIGAGCPISAMQGGSGTLTLVAASGASLLNPYNSASTSAQNSTLTFSVAGNPDGLSAAWLIQTGALTVPTQAPGDTSNRTASDAFVAAAVAAGAYTLPADTLTVLGGIKGNVTLVARTSSTINVTIGAVSLLGAGVLPSISVTVSGVALGDNVSAAFSGAPPTGIAITSAQVTAANTVQITPVATTALVVSSQTVPVNFFYSH